MSAAKHTPGPWAATVSGEEVELHDTSLEGNFRLYVYNLTDGVKLTEADARLAAAAPDLLEALEGMLARNDGNAADERERRIVKALTAICKARGEA